MKELPEPQRVRAREIIERQVEHLVCLIDDLLDVSRITRSMITLNREPVLAGAVIAGAVETMRPAIDARRQELTLDLPDELITVDGDKTRLVQVLGNILSNASKFTDVGGRIHLKVAREGPSVAISVTDNGIGIAPELMPRIFELFAQVHARSQTPQGGLGIGLALVRRLVEMHGGSVSAESGGAGKGTEFIVRLPVVPTPSRAATTPSPSEVIPHLQARRILVADDNYDAAESLATLLELRGHEVRKAHDGEEVLAIGETFEPEIVLLDLGMPTMDGYETARRLRRSAWGEQATVVAITGWGQQQDRQRTAKAGFDAHLVKPVTEASLCTALAAADAGVTRRRGSALRERRP
jgi:CheY-like chemotaxis protein/two-component sensor histidine kinase